MITGMLEAFKWSTFSVFLADMDEVLVYLYLDMGWYGGLVTYVTG